MPFIDIDAVPRYELLPGVRIRTPFGQHVMLSYLEMDAGAVVPTHRHPHEQAGMLLEGRMELTIGDETRVVEPGAMFIIQPNVPTGRWPSAGRCSPWTSSARRGKTTSRYRISTSRPRAEHYSSACSSARFTVVVGPSL